MFKNVEQTLFTHTVSVKPTAVNVSQVAARRNTSAIRSTNMSAAGPSLAGSRTARQANLTSMKASLGGQAASRTDISMSLKGGQIGQSSAKGSIFRQNAPRMSMAGNTAFGNNNYSRLATQMSSTGRNCDISMSLKNTGVSQNNLSSTRMNQNQLRIGMNYQRAAPARSSKLQMSASFNISGNTNNNMIDNYQDSTFSGAKKATGGWTSAANVSAFQRKHGRASRLTMMATPEGSWGDVARQPVVGGNWKSNGDMDFVNSFPKDVLNKSEFDASKMSVCVAPTDIHLTGVKAHVKDTVHVMAQDVSQYPKGAYTGNVTADQLKDIGINWTLTGHSERRTLHHESDADVAKKTKAAIEEGVTVMACIGEQKEERENGLTGEVNARQLQAIADELEDAHWGQVVIAYEPVWAIGTGLTATPEQAEETHMEIRHWLAENVSEEVAGKTRILYGGSVNAGNCAELIKKPNIDGFLVGGASLKDDFKTIIETVAATV